MSSFSDEIECPNCGNGISEHTDSRHGVSAQCHHCGYEKYTRESQMSLENLNSLREDMTDALEEEFPPLEALPGWSLDNNSQKIILSIKNSAVFATQSISGIEMEIHDYDVEQLNDSDGLITDSEGKKYLLLLPNQEDGEFETA